ncbi:MAG: DUF5679 domain-containing protein [Anaerolineaceae bacterium]|nr:DUF5679 domain-containing protein [Anaerolineaceae bacterium]
MKLPHSVIVKSPGLLPMLYTVRELSKELSIPERTLRDWLAAGAPVQKDNRGRMMVNGCLFYDWVQENKNRKKTRKLKDNESYCFRCKAVVPFQLIEKRAIKGKLVHLKGICVYCGGVINRGGRDE